jgi:hypothetical protein
MRLPKLQSKFINQNKLQVQIAKFKNKTNGMTSETMFIQHFRQCK